MDLLLRDSLAGLADSARIVRVDLTLALVNLEFKGSDVRTSYA